MIYGYCRVSTKHQRITRQITNITELYPNATLINNLLMALAEEQIKSAFLQSEKEVTDLHTRISQGMRESKKNGNRIGLEKGTTLVTEKSIKCKEIIKKHATDFGGTLSDPEVMTLCKISRNSYYKYKRELKTTA